MPSMKQIKRRRTSVKNTQQIMKAMNLVATSKMQKARARLASVRPLFEETTRVMASASRYEGADQNIFIKPRPVKNKAYIIITGDLGLCGGYNANISKEALAHMGKEGNEKLFCIGTKGADYFRRRGKRIEKRYAGVAETALYKDAQDIGKTIMELYKKGEVR